MAFAYTVDTLSGSPDTVGARKEAFGTYTSSGGGTGGDIKTGLNRVNYISLQSKGSAVIADAPVVNETLPLSSGDVTIVTAANEVGSWYAVGT